VLGVPLREVQDALEMAYFHEARSAGLRMHEVASLLDVSIRKAALLSKRLKRNFLRADERVALPRRIEFLLWAQPLSHARIAQSLPGVTERDLDRALALLLREGRARRARRGRTEVFERAHPDARLVGPSWEARFDALHNLLGNVSATVFARFFRDDAKALARTIQFQMRAEDLPRLAALYEQVWAGIREIEAAAAGDPQALRMDLSMIWAPYGYFEKTERGER
jgi:hypothetical protein